MPDASEHEPRITHSSLVKLGEFAGDARGRGVVVLRAPSCFPELLNSAAPHFRPGSLVRPKEERKPVKNYIRSAGWLVAVITAS
jgi:hypothetical protein